MKHGLIRVGISGWTYAPWRGVFYPRGLAHHHELHFAADHFPAIEINGTFYALQTPDSYQAWRAQVGADFVFALKGPRYITHILRLKNVRTALANFMASGPLALGPHLGPILWQFPQNMRFDPQRFASFLDLLPRDTAEAARLAIGHDRHVPKAWTAIDRNRKLRYAFEVRHDSFRVPAFVDLLRDHNAALVCADSAAWPRLMDVTADFVYCRLHGATKTYESDYDEAALSLWAQWAKTWANGEEPADAARIGAPARRKRRDVFIFFDNDRRVRAPANAQELIRRLRA
ncbi:MAG TPA: DUF72 domain-containing protein [Rhodopila sp.]|uniref:DUF72 domain-containing protein n=1 Tax=Rhodopila sp. TaxID=2480087 RepID=UPI002B6738FE|nr:DUF72 domain-containing protein [Rhodopila sp.]HVY15081.1 DUF72 domain-containing protein [Rhodopila sp.]